MIATPIQPYARLRRLSDDTVLASTTLIVDAAGSDQLDRAGTLTVTALLVDAGDAGGGSAVGTGFAQLLYAAAGTDDGLTPPTPVLLEFGLAGAAGPIDARKLVEAPVRTLRAEGPVVTEDGDDLWVLYATVGVDRETYTDVRLADALGGARGGIRPLADTGGTALLSADGTIPNQAGILAGVTPGSPSWPASALARITYTPLVDPSIADAPTNVDVWADYAGKAIETIVQRLGGVYVAADPAPLGTRGHVVPDASDYPLNIADTLGLR